MRTAYYAGLHPETGKVSLKHLKLKCFGRYRQNTVYRIPYSTTDVASIVVIAFLISQLLETNTQGSNEYNTYVLHIVVSYDIVDKLPRFP